MNEVTELVLNELLDTSFKEAFTKTVKDNLRFFEVLNIGEVIKEYDFLSHLQYESTDIEAIVKKDLELYRDNYLTLQSKKLHDDPVISERYRELNNTRYTSLVAYMRNINVVGKQEDVRIVTLDEVFIKNPVEFDCLASLDTGINRDFNALDVELYDKQGNMIPASLIYSHAPFCSKESFGYEKHLDYHELAESDENNTFRVNAQAMPLTFGNFYGGLEKGEKKLRLFSVHRNDDDDDDDDPDITYVSPSPSKYVKERVHVTF